MRKEKKNAQLVPKRRRRERYGPCKRPSSQFLQFATCQQQKKTLTLKMGRGRRSHPRLEEPPILDSARACFSRDGGKEQEWKGFPFYGEESVGKRTKEAQGQVLKWLQVPGKVGACRLKGYFPLLGRGKGENRTWGGKR